MSRMRRTGNAALILIVLLIAGAAVYGMQSGMIDTTTLFQPQSTIDGVDVYWAKDAAPPSCAAASDGIDVKVIARDNHRRFNEDGRLVFEWKSSDGWQEFARQPTECAQQPGDLFCTVETSFGVTQETAINGVMYTRAKLTTSNGTAYAPSKRTEIGCE